MISSKDISVSQRLKCSLDVFCTLGVFLRNSGVAAVQVCLQVFHNVFADLRMSLGYFDLLPSVCNSNCLNLHILSFKYSEESFGTFFALQLLPIVSTKFSTFYLFVL